MKARERMKEIIHAMSDGELLATFKKIDAAIITPRESPVEFEVRLHLCDELDARGVDYAPEYNF